MPSESKECRDGKKKEVEKKRKLANKAGRKKKLKKDKF